MKILHNSIKTKGILLTGLIMLALGLPLHAAWLDNVPVTVVQPNGDTLHLFATGDEFYHYIHDAEGYTILLSTETGYYVYAEKVNNQLIASNYIYGTINPSEKGIPPRLTITDDEYYQRMQEWERHCSYRPPYRSSNTNPVEINHIVIFISLADDPVITTKNYSEVNYMLNSTISGARSVYNYFKTVSYDRTHIISSYYPVPEGEQLLCYFEEEHTRDYYREYHWLHNRIGYRTKEEKWEREYELLNNAIEYVKNEIPADLELDYDNDGYVDVITFAVNTEEDPNSAILWPHKTGFTEEASSIINGKQTMLYTFELIKSVHFYLNTFCHELNHVFGSPDFYRNNNNIQLAQAPLGRWDIMCYNHDEECDDCSPTGNRTANPSAYIKWKYLHWIDEIPTITEPGVYTLHALGSHETQNAYKIASSVPDQYYVLEYRDNNVLFDENIYGKGLVIYRVNEESKDYDGDGEPDYRGNIGADPPRGKYDELYIFRPGGNLSNVGQLEEAFFSMESGRVAFNQGTNPSPCLSNGTPDRNISIFDISEAGNTISFTYGYKIEVSSNNEQGGTVTGGGLFAYNSTCTLIATPNPGYIFKGWYTPAGLFPVNPLPTFTFNVTSSMNLVAKFQPATPTTDVYQYYCWFDQDYSTVQTGSFQTTETFFALDASALSEGIHTLHVMLDDNGLTAPKTYLFLKTPEVLPVSSYNYHCWFDQDYSTVQTGTFGGGGYSVALDASELDEGIHTLHVMLEGNELTSAKTYIFLKAPVTSPTSTYTYHCWFDQDYETVQTGTFGGDGYCFALDVGELDNGLHFVNVMLEGNELTSAKRYLFCKKPAGGSGIYRWAYCLNGQWSDAVVTTLAPTVQTLDILTMLPVDPQPIRSVDFEFEPNGGQPEIYAKNTITFRFWDDENRFLDRSAVYVDATVHEPVVADWIQRNTTETIATPAANHIHWFKLDAEVGDSLAFKSDVYCTMELFAPSGARQFKVMNAASVAFNGICANESGIYYLAVHDVEGSYENVSVTYLFLREMTAVTALNAGWNWWTPTVWTDISTLQSTLSDYLIQIQVQDEMPTGNINPGKMLKIQTSVACALSLRGMPITAASITVNPGATWFGYIGEAALITQALNGFPPSMDDKIISQDGGFAVYNGTEWKGTLTTLEPGKGYVYVSTAAWSKTIVFE